ncbi:DsbA family protein [Aureimonas jatrophae]|uniref:Protein-disulfide isomerase n=1 Tax=Aureimonas jatrophae TaxID=1166073 RepID=A0A1H0GPV9_9HYPH|nr:DsbA family protein [Aureimonas jatrophae]MBB3949693.1 protein-disulfide isomerase [Aureimonas jatrophae]SDO08907.1 Protein-disulfide isomerase [Aureimonas jatrophae]
MFSMFRNTVSGAAAGAVLLALGSTVAWGQTAPAPASTVEAPAPEGTADVAKLLAPQALPDVVLGDPDAKVTIIEYASMTCSHCRDFHAETWPTIKRDYVDTGKAKFILREFPFDPRALAAFMLARCAGDDKRTAMVDVLFDQQREWAGAENASVALLKIAQLSGMSQDQFKACLSNSELQGKVVAVQAAGQSDFGVSATPTFFVNGDKYAGALSAEQMAAVIEKHL